MSETISLKHAAPADQPTHVHEIAGRLFAAYTIDDGSVHLAGCTMDDRPFMRLGFGHEDRRAEIYVDEEGAEVDAQRVQALGMTDTTELEKPPVLVLPDVERLAECGTRLARERLAGAGSLEPADRTIVWCKFSAGKLRFTVGEHVAELPFCGWARLLEPPPFVCPYTGRSTFHLAATDDGRIAAAEGIEACAETGRRLLSDDLVTCSVTGRRVVPELVATCPVTGQPLLPSSLVECSTCRQQVSPAALEEEACAACRNLEPADKADPRIARLIQRHPALDRWRSWRISETATVQILVASGWFQRLLLVVDKGTLEAIRLATGTRLSSQWETLAPSQLDSAGHA